MKWDSSAVQKQKSKKNDSAKTCFFTVGFGLVIPSGAARHVLTWSGVDGGPCASWWCWRAGHDLSQSPVAGNEPRARMGKNYPLPRRFPVRPGKQSSEWKFSEIKAVCRVRLNTSIPVMYIRQDQSTVCQEINECVRSRGHGQVALVRGDISLTRRWSGRNSGRVEISSLTLRQGGTIEKGTGKKEQERWFASSVKRRKWCLSIWTPSRNSCFTMSDLYQV